jgi:hypothetical protein
MQIVIDEIKQNRTVQVEYLSVLKNDLTRHDSHRPKLLELIGNVQKLIADYDSALQKLGATTNGTQS